MDIEKLLATILLYAKDIILYSQNIEADTETFMRQISSAEEQNNLPSNKDTLSLLHDYIRNLSEMKKALIELGIKVDKISEINVKNLYEKGAYIIDESVFKKVGIIIQHRDQVIRYEKKLKAQLV